MKTKKFDAVAFMRIARVEIDEQDAGLTWEERHNKTLNILEDDPLRQALRNRTVRQARRLSQSTATLEGNDG